MAWYDSGTIAVTNGSTAVTGTGTNFITGAQAGEAFYAPDGKLYEIASISSSTGLVLADVYLGSTASGQDYKIIPTQSLVADLAGNVTTLISDFADVRDYAGEGKFNDGSVTAPGIGFTQDSNNGLYRIGSDNWGMSAGGQKQVDISTTDVELNYSGSKKLATTSSGVDVTGTITADGLTVEGSTGITVRNDAAGANEPKLVFDNDTFAGANHAQIQTGNGGLQLLIESPSTSTFQNRHQILMNGGGGDDVTFRLSTDNGSTYKNQLKIDNNDVSFYEDTGTTAKMVWDASAESLGIAGGASSGTALSVSNNFNNVLKVTQTDTGMSNGTYTLEVDSTSHNSNVSTAGAMAVDVNSGRAFTINGLGNVGIGTASPNSPLTVQSDSGGGNITLIGRASDGYSSVAFKNNANTSILGAIFVDDASDSMQVHVAGSERARLDSSGNLLVGKTANSTSTTGHGFTGSGLAYHVRSGGEPLLLNRLASDGEIINLLKDGATVGSIGALSSQTYIGSGDTTGLIFHKSPAFIGPKDPSSPVALDDNNISLGWTNQRFKDLYLSGGVITSSDYRLKEDVQPMQSYADTIRQMNLVNFAWKDSGEREDGFIAHELQSLVPSAVRGDKDAIDEDGNEQYQGVDPLKLIPVLTKALQEALERIEILENK